MAKVGLKETLSLLAAGYKKKDIEALAAIDEEQEKEQTVKHENQEIPAPIITESVPAPVPAPVPVPEKTEDPEPDYKAMYEELLEKNKKTEATVTKLQQDNIHKDSAPAAAEAKAKENESLQALVRSYM